MESLTSSRILNFNSDTLQYVRKQHNLDHPERMKEAIDIIEEWIRKQNHFAVKCFPRDFIERVIIFNKGSLEKAKFKLDSICTLRALHPHFFSTDNIEDRRTFPELLDAILPTMTTNHYRIYLHKNSGQKFERGFFIYLKYLLYITEYLQVNDYNNGFIAVYDFTEVNLFEYIKALNIVELKITVTILLQGYGTRIKGLHIISDNVAIYTVVAILKQLLSEKISNRLVVHKTLDTLYDYIPKQILPEDYGGDGLPLQTIHDNTLNEILSNNFIQHVKETNEAIANEEYRIKQCYDTDIMGVAGTFRSLQID